jgi:hypothetical protein
LRATEALQPAPDYRARDTCDAYRSDARDISDRERVEQALRQRKRELRDII